MPPRREHIAPNRNHEGAVMADQKNEGRVPTMPPKKKKGRGKRVLIIVLLLICVCSLGAAGVILFGYQQGEQSYEEVQTHFEVPEDPAVVMDASTPESPGAKLVDWSALRAINPDIVGWLYVPNTPINYPVMQGDDNDYYLHHDFYGSEGIVATYGSIYLAAENSPDFSDKNNVLFGHHLNNGTMFAAIAEYGDPAVFNDRRTSYLLTPQGNYQLRSFAVLHIASDDPIGQLTFEDDQAYVDYLQNKIDRSEVPATDIPAPTEMDKTFVFSTCDNLFTNGRWALCNYVEKFVPTTAAGEGMPEEAVDAAQTAESGEAPAVE
ncbi:class B sortase [Eggerthellaceae bacterium zg-887]|nr:class B sortase [Xiamenia xianingshaonis]